MHREDAVMLHLALTIIPAAMSVLFIVLGALTIAIPEQLSGAGAPDTVTCLGNTTRPACAADIGDTVTLECPVNYTSSWRRDNEEVCDNSTCTLPSIRTNDLGLYTCGGGNEVVLIQDHVDASGIEIGTLFLLLGIALLLITVLVSITLFEKGRYALKKLIPVSLLNNPYRTVFLGGIASVTAMLLLLLIGIIVAASGGNNTVSCEPTNARVSTCTPCQGDKVEMECPLSLGFWERDDGHIVCLDQTCTLDDVDKDDLGFYECGLGLYGLVMAVEVGDCQKNTFVWGLALVMLAMLLLLLTLLFMLFFVWSVNQREYDIENTVFMRRLILTQLLRRNIEERRLPNITPIIDRIHEIPDPPVPPPAPSPIPSSRDTAQNIPRWLDAIVSLRGCTHRGKVYHNEENDFRLKIPEGAIPEGQRVTIDIGVALYGPIRYPQGLRPVSPVFWICVRGRNNFQFRKPVEITIDHCLRLDKGTDIQSLGLTFVKAGHSQNNAGKYELSPANGAQDFHSDLCHGTLTTNHFCCLCICTNTSYETTKNLYYSLIVVHPKPVRANGNSQLVQFFLTFSLQYCISALKKRFPREQYVFIPRKFVFKYEGNDISLQLNYEPPSTKNWQFVLGSIRKISVADIEFHNKDSDQLQVMSSMNQYPPRFSVELNASGITEESRAYFAFPGATEQLTYELPLLPQD